MFNTLIWATDGSATAERALPFVRTLAAPDAQVYAVHTAASGSAARQIANVARDVEAELILVGTRGYGRVAGLILGSTTHGLLHAGVCPVLACRRSRRRSRTSASSGRPPRAEPAGKPQDRSA